MQTVQWHNEEYTENVSWNGSMWGMSALVEIKDVCKVYNPGENEEPGHWIMWAWPSTNRNLWHHPDIPEAVSPRWWICWDAWMCPPVENIGSMDRMYPHWQTMNCRISATGRSALFSRDQSDPQSDCGGKCRTATDLPGSIQKCTAGAFQRSTEKGGTGTPYGS